MKQTILLGLILICLFSCEKEENTDNSDFIDTFELITDDCTTTIGQSTICFDTVLTDSRCASGANCKWEGNAIIRLDLLTSDSKNHKIELNTNPDFAIDTTIGGIYLLLTGLTPYPEISMVIKPKDYKANLTIANIDKLKSNAKIINFNPDKCGCCWGWTIKIGNDTIKSDDEIIGKTVGYNIDYPVDIYVETGDIKQTCSDMGGFDYYNLKTMIKIE